MGLLQQIEGIFGFGKKANQTSQNATAIDNAITAAQQKLAAGQIFVEALKPFAAENPIFSAAIATEEVVEADTQTALSWLKTLVPAPTPVSVTATPAAAPPATPAP